MKEKRLTPEQWERMTRLTPPRGRAVDISPRSGLFDWIRANYPQTWPAAAPSTDRPHWAFKHPTEDRLLDTAETDAMLYGDDPDGLWAQYRDKLEELLGRRSAGDEAQ